MDTGIQQLDRSQGRPGDDVRQMALPHSGDAPHQNGLPRLDLAS